MDSNQQPAISTQPAGSASNQQQYATGSKQNTASTQQLTLSSKHKQAEQAQRAHHKQ
jgi:hypothetical protein